MFRRRSSMMAPFHFKQSRRLSSLSLGSLFHFDNRAAARRLSSLSVGTVFSDTAPPLPPPPPPPPLSSSSSSSRSVDNKDQDSTSHKRKCAMDSNDQRAVIARRLSSMDVKTALRRSSSSVSWLTADLFSVDKGTDETTGAPQQQQPPPPPPPPTPTLTTTSSSTASCPALATAATSPGKRDESKESTCLEPPPAVKIASKTSPNFLKQPRQMMMVPSACPANVVSEILHQQRQQLASGLIHDAANMNLNGGSMKQMHNISLLIKASSIKLERAMAQSIQSHDLVQQWDKVVGLSDSKTMRQSMQTRNGILHVMVSDDVPKPLWDGHVF